MDAHIDGSPSCSSIFVPLNYLCIFIRLVPLNKILNSSLFNCSLTSNMHLFFSFLVQKEKNNVNIQHQARPDLGPIRLVPVLMSSLAHRVMSQTSLPLTTTFVWRLRWLFLFVCLQPVLTHQSWSLSDLYPEKLYQPILVILKILL